MSVLTQRFLVFALGSVLLAAASVPAPAVADTASTYEEAKAELADLGHQSDLLVDAYNEKQESLVAIHGRLTALNDRIGGLREQVASAQAQVSREARQMYMHGGARTASTMTMLTGLADADRGGRALKYLGEVHRSTQRALDEFRSAREDLDTEVESLGAEEARLTATVHDLEAKRGDIEDRVARQQALTDRYRNQLEEERRREAEAARARAESAAREAEAQRAAASSDRPAQASTRTSGSAQRPGPAAKGSAAGPGGSAPAPSGGAGAAVAFARAQLGRPYRWGATGPDSYDCSGLTMRAWQAGGKSIPRTSSAQVGALRSVSMSDRQPGDLLWRPGHIALYVGGDSVIAAPQTGDVVSYRSASNYAKAVRP